MNWPVYYKERIWLGNIEKGFVGIVTLWTPKEKIVEKIDNGVREKIACVGQLYTRRGAEYVFRNIWANPKIRYIVLIGKSLTDSGSALFDIGKVVKDIPLRYIKKFEKSVEILDMRGKSRKSVISVIKNLEFRLPFAKKAKIFKEKKVSGDQYPSEDSVFRVEGESVGEVWLQILNLILRFGRRVPRIYVYGGHEKVLLNLAAVITDEDIKNPKMWPFFNFDKKILKKYFRNFFGSVRGDEAYTYGERLFAYEVDGKIVDQVSRMTKKLMSFPYNKGALAVLWQAGIDNFPIRKPWRTPCLTLVQGFCMNDKLYLTAFFRSNDMFGAWPLNAFALRKLQSMIAGKINKSVGDLTIISHTAFVDDTDLVRAEKIVKDNKKMTCQRDRRGDVLVEVCKSMIVVKHLNWEGETLGEYRQDGRRKKAALRIATRLLADNVISRIGHALDVGEQLGRAEDAIKLGLRFEQDKMLV